MNPIENVVVKTLLDNLGSYKVKLDELTLDGHFDYEDLPIEQRQIAGEFFRLMGQDFYRLTLTEHFQED